MLDEDDEEIEGLYTVRFTAIDSCDPDVQAYGYINVYGNDETCNDEDPDFIGYMVLDRDIVEFTCSKKTTCFADDESPDDPMTAAVRIEGPAMRLTVTKQ